VTGTALFILAIVLIAAVLAIDRLSGPGGDGT
jgi:hypothetical protein